jgi:hypothetical protein|nr:MAG TPA: hypothetical protein [Caudoviricetes sp.]
MKSNEKVAMTIFGKERELEICLVGDNEPEYNLETDQFEVVNLTREEEELLNWIKSVDISSLCRDKIIKYINYLNDAVGEDTHDDYDLSDDEVFMPTSILINVEEDMDEETADVALFGESSCAEDEGIMVAFKNGKYFGIGGWDDCMNCFEDDFMEYMD